MRPKSHEVPPPADEDAEGEDAVIAELQEELPWAVAADRTAPVDEFVARIDAAHGESLSERIAHEEPDVADIAALTEADPERPDALRWVDADRPAGQLVEDDAELGAIDQTAEMVAHELPGDESEQSAEEAAVHVRQVW
jgi:Family of unknown function (DUF5709)